MTMLRLSLIVVLASAALAGCQQSPVHGVAARVPAQVQARAVEQPASLEALASRLYGAYYDQVINPAGASAMPIAMLVAAGHLSAEQAQALDRDGDQALSRSEYLAFARLPETRARFKTLLLAIFEHASAGSGFLSFEQRSFEVNFGRRYDPARPNLGPLLVPLTIPAEAFKAADRDGDGRLDEAEALAPIGLAMLNSVLGSPNLGEVVRSIQALPWAH